MSPCLDKLVLGRGGGAVWHEAMVLVCLPLVAPIGLSPLPIPTLWGSERVLVVPTEPLDDSLIPSLGDTFFFLVGICISTNCTDSGEDLFFFCS